MSNTKIIINEYINYLNFFNTIMYIDVYIYCKY